MGCLVLAKVLKKANCKLTKKQLVSLRNEMVELGDQEFINAINMILVKSPEAFKYFWGLRYKKFQDKLNRCVDGVENGQLKIPKFKIRKGKCNGSK